MVPPPFRIFYAFNQSGEEGGQRKEAQRILWGEVRPGLVIAKILLRFTGQLCHTPSLTAKKFGKGCHTGSAVYTREVGVLNTGEAWHRWGHSAGQAL